MIQDEFPWYAQYKGVALDGDRLNRTKPRVDLRLVEIFFEKQLKGVVPKRFNIGWHTRSLIYVLTYTHVEEFSMDEKIHSVVDGGDKQFINNV